MTQIKDDAEQKRHDAAVDLLCSQYPHFKEGVPALYRQRLSDFPEEITIRSYLPIFISRQVKQEIERLQANS